MYEPKLIHICETKLMCNPVPEWLCGNRGIFITYILLSFPHSLAELVIIPWNLLNFSHQSHCLREFLLISYFQYIIDTLFSGRLVFLVSQTFCLYPVLLDALFLTRTPPITPPPQVTLPPTPPITPPPQATLQPWVKSCTKNVINSCQAFTYCALFFVFIIVLVLNQVSATHSSSNHSTNDQSDVWWLHLQERSSSERLDSGARNRM